MLSNLKRINNILCINYCFAQKDLFARFISLNLVEYFCSIRKQLETMLWVFNGLISSVLYWLYWFSKNLMNRKFFFFMFIAFSVIPSVIIEFLELFLRSLIIHVVDKGSSWDVLMFNCSWGKNLNMCILVQCRIY